MPHRDYSPTESHLEEWASLLGTDIAVDSQERTENRDWLDDQ